ncbi:MAG: hypothetical protein LBG04_00630 [Holosporaceae bacterium]|nr:hypothetical protein [Holosporaceae bacterium]
MLLCAFLAVDMVGALGYVCSDFGSVGDINITRRHFENIDSTHTYSRSNLLVSRDSPNEWVLVTATKQTAGVGTHSRKWVSDVAGNIYANLTFHIANRAEEGFSVLSEEKIAALAVYDAVKFVLIEKDVAIKWPNDVIVGGKKISGIIAGTGNPHSEQMTIGIGVNINLPLEKLNRSASHFFERGSW